ncbi:MAG: PLP-dependent transferase [bacterium]|nr:PLP-dependent transferase [bacterium]
MNRDPSFVSRPLGGPFGISVELNTLQDVIDYEEGRLALTHGYPRFVPHKVVAQREHAACHANQRQFGVGFASEQQATFIVGDWCRRFAVQLQHDEPVETKLLLDRIHQGRTVPSVWANEIHYRLQESDGIAVACISDPEAMEQLKLLRRVWGVGFDVHKLAGKDVARVQGDVSTQVRERLTVLEGRPSAHTLLFQSGMAAISAALIAAATLGRRVILVGQGYVDSGLIVRDWGEQIDGFETRWLALDEVGQRLETELRVGPAMIFLEVPSSPLLTIPDIYRIRQLAEKHDAWLATDATVATPYSWHPLTDGFDMVIHSTSKFLNGKLNHLGGAAVGTRKELMRQMAKIRSVAGLGMCDNQSSVLAVNLSGFSERMAAINANGREIADRLRGSPEIGQVFYPGFQGPQQERLADQIFGNRCGGLISFTVRDDSLEALRTFYDRVGLPFGKGPSLGAERSLICPYVMLAHYHESRAFLESQGLPFHLLRISVGVEPVDEIWRGLWGSDSALVSPC